MPERDYLLEVLALAGREAKTKLVQELQQPGIMRAPLTDAEVAYIMRRHPRIDYDHYTRILSTNEAAIEAQRLFAGRPGYLARALVQILPEYFYDEGFALKVIRGLKVDLGYVAIPPLAGGGRSFATRLKALPEAVQQDLFGLYREARLEDYIYLMSRDPGMGFADLKEETEKTDDEFEGLILENLEKYCTYLFAMTFPGFVSTLEGNMFPAFHVRWWIDDAADKPRVLNIGETGTFKTSFEVIAMQQYGCERVLVLTPPHARGIWRNEAQRYFTRKNPGRMALIESEADTKDALRARAQFTIIGSSTIVRNGVVDDLLTADPSFDGLIVDECHYYNNIGQAKRAEAFYRLATSLPLKRLIAASATPWVNDPTEMAVMASVLMPEVIPTPDSFRQWGLREERFLRELFARHIMGVNLRDVVDIPEITPHPWEDLFGAEFIEPSASHLEVYNHVKETEEIDLHPFHKRVQLVHASTHPHKLKGDYTWPSHLAGAFGDWRLSTKLVWLKEHIDEALERGEKIVVGSGLHVLYMTQPADSVGSMGGTKNVEDEDALDSIPSDSSLEESEEALWIGGFLEEQYGRDRVMILDGRTSTRTGSDGLTERQRLAARWSVDPKVRIQLISMRAFPDSVRLVVRRESGATGLFITAIAFGWIPWRQFLGRYFRPGQEVPIRYKVPILLETEDVNRLTLVRSKNASWERFQARVGFTAEEFERLRDATDLKQYTEEARPAIEQVTYIGGMMRGRGETAAMQLLEEGYGSGTRAEVFARALLESQDYSASGHIARCMCQVSECFEKQGLVHAEGILDAGCGPLTYERYSKHSVYSVDMNPAIIELGRQHSPLRGVHAQCRFLSQLPEDWTSRFELVLCSLVLHWSGDDRNAILGELVRVTNTVGRIWLAFAESNFTPELFGAWVEAFRSIGYGIIEDLTGLVRSRDGGGAKDQFKFWSLCFSPNGIHFDGIAPSTLRFRFETTKRKWVRGSDQAIVPDSRTPSFVRHEVFDVERRPKEIKPLTEAAEEATQSEIHRIMRATNHEGWRFHKAPHNIPWRSLQEAFRRGLIKV
ncbi:MAG: methyltransferase domain-containing protein [bacterium]|nr:methyltransferase domain-containing protein [bacterium]